MHALTEAVTDYCAKSMGTVGSDDPTPRLLAGLVVGIENAVIELWGRSGLTLPEIFDAAEAAVPDLTRSSRQAVDLTAREWPLPPPAPAD